MSSGEQDESQNQNEDFAVITTNNENVAAVEDTTSFVRSLDPEAAAVVASSFSDDESLTSLADSMSGSQEVRIEEDMRSADSLDYSAIDVPLDEPLLDLSTNFEPMTLSEEPVVDSLNIGRLSAWITAICVVHFDLELGQALECVYPPIELSEVEKSNICFSAFADSNSSIVGDISYTFRMRKTPQGNDLTNATDKILYVRQDHFTYGFVYFRQQKDPSIKRGYFQKSVVILSPKPYLGLFREVVELLTPAFFELGQPMLETACHTISSWPPPVPGQTYELPFLGRILHLRLPQRHVPQYTDFTPAPPTQGLERDILIPVRGVSLYKCFQDILHNLYQCWELSLLAEPLVVMSTSTTICSDAVLALVSLISPIPYGGDYRPYFTIHDSDFKEFTTKTKSPVNVILGVTNPYFVKALEHWPHFVRVGPSTQKVSNGRASVSKSLDFVQGVTSSHKSIVAVDKKLLKKLSEMKPHQCDEADIAISNHFSELTRSFLVPLERYFASLIPVTSEVSPWKMPPRPRPFKIDQFMVYLQEIGPQMLLRTTRRSEWVGLYTKFLKSPNFHSWLRLRVKQADLQLRRVYLRALQDADVANWMKDKHEVRRVDFMLRIQDEMRVPASVQFLGEQGVRCLQQHIITIILGLPEDLRRSIVNTAQTSLEPVLAQLNISNEVSKLVTNDANS